MPENKKTNILLCHAISGCDVVSGIHGIGKTKLIKSSILEDFDYNTIFRDQNCEIDDIVRAGEEIVLKMYGKHIHVLLWMNYEELFSKESCIANQQKRKSTHELCLHRPM